MTRTYNLAFLLLLPNITMKSAGRHNLLPGVGAGGRQQNSGRGSLLSTYQEDKMDIKHIQYLVEIRRVHSISQAAENLYLASQTWAKICGTPWRKRGLSHFRAGPARACIPPVGPSFAARP